METFEHGAFVVAGLLWLLASSEVELMETVNL